MKTEAEKKAQRSEINRRWREANKEKVREHSRLYRGRHDAAHPDYQKEYQRKWREAHPDYQQKWRDANPDKSNSSRRFRNDALRSSIPEWSEAEAIALLYKKRDELNELYGLELEVDHIIPVKPKDRSVCGLHCWANLQLLDKTINNLKRDKYQTDW